METASELQILKNVINLMPKTYRKRNMNWVIVGDILLAGTKNCGSGSCYNKCEKLGINPDGYDLTQEDE